MTRPWTGLLPRRLALGLLAGAAALLAGCGSGSVVSDFYPTRLISVGDSFSDVGQKGSDHLFTVNDGTPIWVQALASHYGLAVKPANEASGAPATEDGSYYGYAEGYARIAVDGVSSATSAPSVKQQIDAVLERVGGILTRNDFVVVTGGISDIVAAVQDNGGTVTPAATAAVRSAGTALASQVDRLVDAGARHVLVVGAYNLGHTPWAAAHGSDVAGDIEALSVAFNDAVRIGLAKHDGRYVLFSDLALLHNLIYNRPGNYAFEENFAPVCATPDAQTCTPSTLTSPDIDYNTRMYADQLHFTPRMSRVFASDAYSESVYSLVKNTW